MQLHEPISLLGMESVPTSLCASKTVHLATIEKSAQCEMQCYHNQDCVGYTMENNCTLIMEDFCDQNVYFSDTVSEVSRFGEN